MHYGASLWIDGYPPSHLLTLDRGELERAHWWVPPRADKFWFYAYNCQAPGTTPVYRLYHPDARNHLLTIDAAERDSALAQGYGDEGIAFYAFARDGDPPSPYDRYPVSRYFVERPIPNSGGRLAPRHVMSFQHAYYLGDSPRSAGWRNEGVRFWVPQGNPAAPPPAPPPIRTCRFLFWTYRC